MAGLESVAIFWDYENCRPASNASGYSVTSSIRRAAHTFGSVKLFRAYLALSEASSSKSSNLRSELQSSGVSLTDCPHNGQKDVADKMIIVDMLSYAIDNPGPSTIILISGDRDFAYAASILRLRRYRMVIMAPSVPTVHISLRSQASVFLDWKTDVMGKTHIRDPSTSSGRVSCMTSPPLSPQLNPERRSSYPLAPPLSLTTPRADVCCEPSSRDGNGAFCGKFSETWPLNVVNCHAEGCLSRNSQMNDPQVDRTQLPTSIRPEAVKRTRPGSQSTDTFVRSTHVSQTPIPDSHVGSQRICSLPVVVDMAKPIPNSVPRSITTTQAFGDDPVWRGTQRNTKVDMSACSSHVYEPPYPPALLSNTVPIMHSMPSPTSPIPKACSFLMTDIGQRDEQPRIVTVDLSSDPRTPPEPAVQGTSHDPPSATKVVPSKFRIFVEMLERQHMKGITRVSRSFFAETLKKQDPMIYERAGVQRFRQYVAQAEKAGIVQLGVDKSVAWISLHPHWRKIPSGS